ncbi:MAG: hypothetical protein RL662_1026 [Bacteroidota bacterium]
MRVLIDNLTQKTKRGDVRWRKLDGVDCFELKLGATTIELRRECVGRGAIVYQFSIINGVDDKLISIQEVHTAGQRTPAERKDLFVLGELVEEVRSFTLGVTGIVDKLLAEVLLGGVIGKESV